MQRATSALWYKLSIIQQRWYPVSDGRKAPESELRHIAIFRSLLSGYPEYKFITSSKDRLSNIPWHQSRFLCGRTVIPGTWVMPQQNISGCEENSRLLGHRELAALLDIRHSSFMLLDLNPYAVDWRSWLTPLSLRLWHDLRSRRGPAWSLMPDCLLLKHAAFFSPLGALRTIWVCPPPFCWQCAGSSPTVLHNALVLVNKQPHIDFQVEYTLSGCRTTTSDDTSGPYEKALMMIIAIHTTSRDMSSQIISPGAHECLYKSPFAPTMFRLHFRQQTTQAYNHKSSSFISICISQHPSWEVFFCWLHSHSWSSPALLLSTNLLAFLSVMRSITMATTGNCNTSIAPPYPSWTRATWCAHYKIVMGAIGDVGLY